MHIKMHAVYIMSPKLEKINKFLKQQTSQTQKLVHLSCWTSLLQQNVKRQLATPLGNTLFIELKNFDNLNFYKNLAPLFDSKGTQKKFKTHSNFNSPILPTKKPRIEIWKNNLNPFTPKFIDYTE